MTDRHTPRGVRTVTNSEGGRLMRCTDPDCSESGIGAEHGHAPYVQWSPFMKPEDTGSGQWALKTVEFMCRVLGHRWKPWTKSGRVRCSRCLNWRDDDA